MSLRAGGSDASESLESCPSSPESSALEGMKIGLSEAPPAEVDGQASLPLRKDEEKEGDFRGAFCVRGTFLLPSSASMAIGES